MKGEIREKLIVDGIMADEMLWNCRRQKMACHQCSLGQYCRSDTRVITKEHNWLCGEGGGILKSFT